MFDSKGNCVDLYLKCAIEGAVIKWATQIDEVLKEDSSCAFVKESNPTPRFGMYTCSDILQTQLVLNFTFKSENLNTVKISFFCKVLLCH